MKKIYLSVDDACQSDLKVAKLARKYDLHCVFYWPVDLNAVARANFFTALTPHEASIISRDFMIGSHTITHRLLTKIPEDEAKQEILDSKHFLQNLYQQPIDNFAPPRGYTNDVLTEFTLRFYEKQRLTRGDNLVHVHPNSGANNNKKWQDVADRKIKKGDIELWFHSWELDKYDLWKELEDYLERN